MNKSLFLLPLLAAGLVLTGCGNNEGGGNTGGNTDTGDKIEFDLAKFVTEKDNYGVQEIKIDDITYYDRQVYYSEGKSALWFFNKWDDNMDEKSKATSSTVWAFIANKDAYKKSIDKIVFKTNVGTGGPMVYGTFGDSAFSDAQKTGSKVTVTSSKENEYTIKNDGNGKYFALSTYGDVGYGVKNLMLDSLTIYFK